MSHIFAPRRQQIFPNSLLGWRRKALVHFNRELPITNTQCFVLQYPLQAVYMAPSCNFWSCVSVAVKASYQFLVAKLEGEVWSGALLLCITRDQDSSSSVVCCWNIIIKQLIYLLLSACNTTEPFNCFLQLSHLLNLCCYSLLLWESSRCWDQLTSWARVSFLTSIWVKEGGKLSILIALPTYNAGSRNFQALSWSTRAVLLLFIYLFIYSLNSSI